MSVSIPFSFTAGTKARASEVNQDFQAVAAKFTEGAGGIGDSDISTTAGIKGSKLSSVAGNRITQAQMDDDAVDLRILKDDATAGSPNAAVNNTNHIKDAIVTNAKLVDATIKKGKLNLASVLITTISMPPNSGSIITTGLLSSASFPVTAHTEVAGQESVFVDWRLHLNTTDGTYYLHAFNSSGSFTLGIRVRIWYLVV